MRIASLKSVGLLVSGAREEQAASRARVDEMEWNRVLMREAVLCVFSRP